jgi:hypothetical protein
MTAGVSRAQFRSDARRHYHRPGLEPARSTTHYTGQAILVYPLFNLLVWWSVIVNHPAWLALSGASSSSTRPGRAHYQTVAVCRVPQTHGKGTRADGDLFVVGRPRHSFWRQRGSLPWTRRRAHDNLCRVSSSTVGQKKLHRTAVDGVMEGLPCAWREALDKLCHVPPCGRRHCFRKTFFNCFQKTFLSCVVHGAHGKP